MDPIVTVPSGRSDTQWPEGTSSSVGGSSGGDGGDIRPNAPAKAAPSLRWLPLDPERHAMVYHSRMRAREYQLVWTHRGAAEAVTEAGIITGGSSGGVGEMVAAVGKQVNRTSDHAGTGAASGTGHAAGRRTIWAGLNDPGRPKFRLLSGCQVGGSHVG